MTDVTCGLTAKKLGSVPCNSLVYQISVVKSVIKLLCDEKRMGFEANLQGASAKAVVSKLYQNINQ